MTILTPFEKKDYQFYLNYKENFYKCKGTVTIDEKKFTFNNLKGLVDSGKGVWPYKHEWVWSSLTSSINGVDFCWNLGFGFGDLSNATENMIFFNRKAIPLGEIEANIDYNNQAIQPVFIKDKNGIFEAKLEPIFDHFTHTDFIWVHNKCHQVFYKASGLFKINNKTFHFKDITCFLEHANNQW